MNNFTKSSWMSFWHSITNLTCCSIGFRAIRAVNMKAVLLLMFFSFSVGSMFAQTSSVERSTFYEVCIDERPSGFTEEEVAFLYASQCEGNDINVIISENLQGNDCGWQSIYTYQVICGDLDVEFKVTYEGGDTTAPKALDPNAIPSGGEDMNLCFENIPEGPTEAEIAALYEDDCGAVNVVKSGDPVGTDCEWSVTYTYAIVDDCGNYADSVNITYSGGDTLAPELAKNAVLPVGESGLNVCYDEHPDGPSAEEVAALFTDVCGNVNVTKTPAFKGTDCGWKGFVTYTIEDDCGNRADDIVLHFSGADTEDPVFVELPGDITVSCIDDIPADKDGLEFTDNCTEGDKGLYALSEDDYTNLGLACEGGYVIRTWTATDDCGNSTSHSITITVLPAPPAEFAVPQDYTINCDDLSTFQAQSLSYSNGVSAGACAINGEVQGTPDAFEGSCGEFLVHYQYADECGRTIEATQTVTVEDNTPPVIEPGKNEEAECDGLGNVDEYQAYLDSNGGATATDNCGNVTWSYTVIEEDNCGLSVRYFVDFIATDDCGNSSVWKGTFDVEDNTAPELEDAMDMTVECDGQGNLAQLNAWLESNGGATGEDACSDFTWSHNFEALSDDCGATGSVTVEFTATDECGNVASTSATFTIEDTEGPEIEDAMDMTVDCDGQGNGAELEAWLESNGGATAEDICSDVTWSNNFDGLSDDCGATGSATVEFTATDDCGNTSKTTATFTIQDVDSPPITNSAQDMTVECDGTGNVDAYQAWLADNGGAEAYDNCSEVTWSYVEQSSTDDCGLTSSVTVLFTVTDDCGLSSSTAATFYIEDTTPPSLEPAKDVTVECGEYNNSDVNRQTPSSIDDWLNNNGEATAGDLCGNVTWSNDFDGLSDDCGETGSATVTFTATDDCGNSASTTATYTIVDTTAPSIDVYPSDLTVECDGAGNQADLDGWLASFAGASGSDICGDVTWSHNFDGLSDDCGATGSATVEFTVTDECGNDSKASATFTIVDTTDPEIEDAMDMTVECDGQGNLAQLNAWLESNGGATAEDICSDVSWSNNFEALSDDCGATGSVTVEFTAYDDCENSSKTTATFTIVDTTDPDIDTSAKDETVECDGKGNIEQLNAWLESNGGAYASDACSEVYWENNFSGLTDDCGATGSATVEFTVYDDCGNSSKTTATFTIEDTEGPMFEVEAQDMTVECDGQGNQAQLDAWLASNGGAYAYDVCSYEVSWSNDFSGLSDDCGATGSATVTFTATDDCGNASTTTATFTIEDTSNPSIDENAQNMTVECDGAGNQAELDAWLANNGGAIASDLCGGVTWSNDFEGLTDECGATGSASVVFTAMDECGNTSKTSATFTIEDTTNPTIDTPAGDMTVECDGAGNQAQLDAWLASFGGAAASDQCGDVTWSYNCGHNGGEQGEPEYVGSFYIHDGEHWTTNPAVYNAKEAAALIFGGSPSEYVTSTDANSINHMAWIDTVYVGCSQGAEDYSLDTNAPGYLDEGGVAPFSTSAYVNDNCPYDEAAHLTYVWRVSTDGNVSDICELSDECGATGSVTVNFVATDDCGNASTTTATFTIEDTTAPSIDTSAKDETVECDGDGNQAQLEAWLASNGGAFASDACGDVEWSNNYEALSDDCGATGSATVEFTATDDCGNSSKTTATFTIVDTTDPSIDVEAQDETVECSTISSDGNCSYTIQLADTFGDGWNGNTLDVLVDGNVVLDDITLDNGSLGDMISFPVSDGAVISTVFTDCGGNFCYVGETSYTIYDTEGVGTLREDGANVESLVAVCPIVMSSDDMFAAWLANNGGAVASDLCGNVTWSNNSQGLSDDCGATGSETVEFTATDDCGNTSKTTATFTVVDTVAPTIDVQAEDMTVECDGQGNQAELADWLASYGGAMASDVCSDVTWSHDFDALSDDCGATGSATVTFTATDDCGNASTTTATFTIEDLTDPTIDQDASDMTVECDGAGNQAQLDAWLASSGGALASDICAGVTWSHNFEGLSDDCGATGSATVVFTATDECGNYAMTTAIFTIVDTTAPSIDTVAKDEVVECDGEGNQAELEAWLANNGGAMASDECSDVTWSYYCGEGNVSGTASASGTGFEILDNQTMSSTAEITGVPDGASLDDANVEISITHTWGGDLNILLTAPTGESIDLISENESNGNDDLTNTTITFSDAGAYFADTELDGCEGVDNVCSVIPNDGSYLFANLLADMMTNGSSPNGDWTLSIFDDAGGDQGELLGWSIDIDYSVESDDVCELSDECGATGSVTVNFVATDDCGNSTETTATFTIQDTVGPTIDTPAADLTVECDGQGNYTDLSNWLYSYAGAAASDDCSDVTWSFDCGYDDDNGNNARGQELCALTDECGATGSVTVDFIATDDCGNETITTATFTIEDTTAPTIDYPAMDMTVECDGQGNVDQLNAWLASQGGAYAYDQCGSVSWSDNFTGLSDDCGETGSATVEFTVSDECGNTSKTTATFTIEDTTPPSIDTSAKDETVECDGNGNIAELEAWLASNGGAYASDICSGVTWSNNFDALSDDCAATGSVTVEFTATDDCGNDSKTTATFTIEDTIAPVLTGVVPPSINDIDACYDMMPVPPTTDEIAALFYEACGDVVVSLFTSPVGNDCGWSVIHIYSVEDECGNPYGDVKVYYSGSDQTAPVLSGVPADVTLECSDPELEPAEVTVVDTCDETAKVEFNEVRTDGDCDYNYTLTRTWSSTDACGNTVSETQVITVQDTTAPELTGQLPTGENQIDMCFPEGEDLYNLIYSDEYIASLYADNCGDVIVTHEVNINGDDCKWILDVAYTISDECGNYANEVKLWYHGGDFSAPVLNDVCSNETMTLYTSQGAMCPSDADITLNLGDTIGIYDSWNVAGLKTSDLGGLEPCFSDNCTSKEDLMFTVVDKFEDNSSCPAILSVTFDVSDLCGNVYEGFVCTFVVIDDEAPIVDCPEDMDLGINPTIDVATGVPYGLADKAPYTDNCDPEGMTFDYTDNLTSEVGQGGNADVMVFSTSWWVITLTHTGYDINGYATYAGGIDNSPGGYYTYTLLYDMNDGRWELAEYFDYGATYNYDVYTSDVDTYNPSCDINDYVEGYDFPDNFLSCDTNGGYDMTNYTLVRTFTATDACGNVGECSVTYTWSEGYDYQVPQADNVGNDIGYGTVLPEDETARQSQVELDFTAYPVPFDKEVTISYNFDFDTDVKVEVYDTKGLLVMTNTNNNYTRGTKGKTKLDLSRGADQLFYVTVTTSQGSVTKKIVSSTLKRR
ncbi:proprotein convertase P-domain-containing protein [Pontimicrobium sp. IMCC45349]|uniref:HYR-like domain-containing protein n=1 Tax=Pontimicrobium sp. IMCC45349 TaxID=3391574 RepID=UPI0039A2CEBD